MAQAPTKHDDPHKSDPHPEPPPKKVVGEPGSLVLPLADSGGAPLVGATGVKGEHIDDGERDPDTIAEEQRRRSAEYEAGMARQTEETRRVAPPENDHRTTKK